MSTPVVDSQRWTKGRSILVAPKESTSFAFMAIGVEPKVHLSRQHSILNRLCMI